MFLGAIILGAVGILFIILGLTLWIGKKIGILHDYHYDKVSAEDKDALCAVSGIGMALMGLGMISSGVILVITDSLTSFIPLAICFAVGIGMLAHGARKYNTDRDADKKN